MSVLIVTLYLIIAPVEVIKVQTPMLIKTHMVKAGSKAVTYVFKYHKLIDAHDLR
jgi:hypothetical protein